MHMKTISPLVATAAVSALLFGAVLMLSKKVGQQVPDPAIKPMKAAIVPPARPQPEKEIGAALQRLGLDVSRVDVKVTDGIVILRGTVADDEAIARIAATVKSLGYERVANMLGKERPADDESIRRNEESTR